MKFTIRKGESGLYHVLVDGCVDPQLMSIDLDAPDGYQVLVQRLRQVYPERMFVVTCDNYGGETHWLIASARIPPKGK